MSFSQYLQETYGLNEVRGFGGFIPPEGTTYSSDFNRESPGKGRRRRAKGIAQELRNDDPTMSINASWKAGQEKAGVRSRHATGSREQQPDSYFSFKNARGQESGLSMSPKQRAKLAADRAERKGQGKRANKIRARMGIGEEVNYVLSHLIDEGYTDNYESAEIIYESMSDEWLAQILDEVTVMSVTSPEGNPRRLNVTKAKPSRELTGLERRSAIRQMRHQGVVRKYSDPENVRKFRRRHGL